MGHLNDDATTLSQRVEQLRKRPPKVHRGGTLTWSLNVDTVNFLVSKVQPGMRTLETGAGLSTVLFAAAGAEHVSINPDPDQIALIRSYCANERINLDWVRFVLGRSEEMLPGLEVPELDLVLIDGGHGFPIPAIDWAYTAPKLRVGGMLIIDDVDLWTGHMLARFLDEEPGWYREATFNRRTVAYVKTAPTVLREWDEQPYVRRVSRRRQFLRKIRVLPRKLMRGELMTGFGKVRV